MAKTLAITYRGASVTISATNYFQLGNAASSGSTTEANRQVTCRTAGVLSNMALRVSSNSTTGASTIATRINGSSGTLSVSPGAGATGLFEDTSNTDSVAAGDEINYIFTPGSAHNISFYALKSCFAANSGSVTLLCNRDQSTSTASVTRYFNLTNHSNSITATEALTQFIFRNAGTIKNLFIYVSSNARSTATTLGTRKNTANGNMSVSVGSSATGVFEDLVNTDSITSGDAYNYRTVTSTGTGSINFTSDKVEFETAGGSGAGVAFGSTSTAVTLAVNITRYDCGQGVWDTTSVTNGQTTLGVAVTVNALSVYLSANTQSVAATFNMRINSTNGTVTLSTTASTTGLFEDTAHSDAYSASDLISVRYTAGAGSGTLSFGVFGYNYTVADSSAIKTFLGLADASTKTFDGLARASVKTVDGLA